MLYNFATLITLLYIKRIILSFISQQKYSNFRFLSVIFVKFTKNIHKHKTYILKEFQSLTFNLFKVNFDFKNLIHFLYTLTEILFKDYELKI